MLSRLGKVLYWTACLVAAGLFATGWVFYEGVDSTGITKERSQGASDFQILEARMRDDVPRKFEYEAALKEGYSPTEILDYFVKINSSKFSRLPEGRSAVVLYLFLGAGALVWLLGLALRYVFAGPSV